MNKQRNVINKQRNVINKQRNVMNKQSQFFLRCYKVFSTSILKVAQLRNKKMRRAKTTIVARQTLETIGGTNEMNI